MSASIDCSVFYKFSIYHFHCPIVLAYLFFNRIGYGVAFSLPLKLIVSKKYFIFLIFFLKYYSTMSNKYILIKLKVSK